MYHQHLADKPDLRSFDSLGDGGHRKLFFQLGRVF